MADYETKLPSLHLTLDNLEELVNIFVEDMDMDNEIATFEIDITKGGLTKSYQSVDEIREDATLPDDLRNITIRVKGVEQNVRIYWNSTGSFSTSRLSINGDEQFVKSKKDDVERFFKNRKIAWRTFLDGNIQQIGVAVVIALIGILLAQTVLPTDDSLVVGAYLLGIILLPLQWGLNRVYPKFVLTRNAEVTRVRYMKVLIRIIVTIVTLFAALASIYNFVL